MSRGCKNEVKTTEHNSKPLLCSFWGMSSFNNKKILKEYSILPLEKIKIRYKEYSQTQLWECIWIMTFSFKLLGFMWQKLHMITLGLNNPQFRLYSKEIIKDVIKDLCMLDFHCSIIYNSKKLEMMNKSHNREMAILIILCLHDD